jgi:hypothetical protein
LPGWRVLKIYLGRMTTPSNPLVESARESLECS